MKFWSIVTFQRISLREKRFDELLAKNADGNIGDVIAQCINDVQQRIKCLEEPVLSRRCSVEEARVGKAFYQHTSIGGIL